MYLLVQAKQKQIKAETLLYKPKTGIYFGGLKNHNQMLVFHFLLTRGLGCCLLSGVAKLQLTSSVWPSDNMARQLAFFLNKILNKFCVTFAYLFVLGCCCLKEPQNRLYWGGVWGGKTTCTPVCTQVFQHFPLANCDLFIKIFK